MGAYRTVVVDRGANAAGGLRRGPVPAAATRRPAVDVLVVHTLV